MSIYDQPIDDTIVFTDLLEPHTFDADFSDTIVFVDTLVNRDPHIIITDSFHFVEAYSPHNLNNSRSRADAITFTELWRATSNPVKQYDSISFFDLWYADAETSDGSSADSISFSDSFTRTLVSSPFSKILSDTITFSETRVAQKVKPLASVITFFEHWCIGVNVARSRVDSITFSDRFTRFVNDFSDVRNNPVSISTGTGFGLLGAARKTLTDQIKFVESYQIVDVDGNPLYVDPCHGTISYVSLHWSTLTESEWDVMTEANWVLLVE